VIAIRPNPPVRISPASTTCPKGVRSRLTEITDNPVTVIAEVTVNKACQRPTVSREHNGEAITKVPTTITSRPVTTVNWGTVS
jgi:hypothetical protein